MDDSVLQVGLLAETDKQLQTLTQLAQENQLQVAQSLRVSALESSAPVVAAAIADAWLILVDLGSGKHALAESWIQQLPQLLIIDSGEQTDPQSKEYPAWRRRMADKLQRLHGDRNLRGQTEDPARMVWALAASTGGPEAIRHFLRALPGNLNVSFIYLQHMNAGYEQSLASIVNRHGQYPAYTFLHGSVIRNNATAIVANEKCINFLSNGTVLLTTEKWPGSYSPSIDQVFANLARSFGQRCGVIVFSGMGADGAAGARLVKQQGGQVWVQTPSSCTVASMPEAVLEAGVVSRMATPAGLAMQLSQYMQQQVSRI